MAGQKEYYLQPHAMDRDSEDKMEWHYADIMNMWKRVAERIAVCPYPPGTGPAREFINFNIGALLEECHDSMLPYTFTHPAFELVIRAANVDWQLEIIRWIRMFDKQIGLDNSNVCNAIVEMAINARKMQMKLALWYQSCYEKEELHKLVHLQTRDLLTADYVEKMHSIFTPNESIYKKGVMPEGWGSNFDKGKDKSTYNLKHGDHFLKLSEAPTFFNLMNLSLPDGFKLELTPWMKANYTQDNYYTHYDMIHNRLQEALYPRPDEGKYKGSLSPPDSKFKMPNDRITASRAYLAHMCRSCVESVEFPLLLCVLAGPTITNAETAREYADWDPKSLHIWCNQVGHVMYWKEASIFEEQGAFPRRSILDVSDN
jgi:hypothetical protein